jgi:hypothetical protein
VSPLPFTQPNYEGSQRNYSNALASHKVHPMYTTVALPTGKAPMPRTPRRLRTLGLTFSRRTSYRKTLVAHALMMLAQRACRTQPMVLNTQLVKHVNARHLPWTKRNPSTTTTTAT